MSLVSSPSESAVETRRQAPNSSLDLEACRKFQSAWWNGPSPAIEHFLPPTGQPNYLATLEELVHIELELRWKAAGEHTDAEERPAGLEVEAYLERFPELNQPDIVRRLLQQEYRVRHAYADRPDTAVYRSRFPELDLNETFSAETTHVSGPAAPDLSPIPGYEILSVIGRGGMGIVLKARQLNLRRIVALKRIISGAYASPEQLARFRREVELVAHLQHPNIVQIYEVGENQGQPFCALEFVAGGTLAHQLAATPQQPRDAAQMVQTLSRAVEAVHTCGIIHRDLKPANVLLTADGIPKIADFGLAKWLPQESAIPAAAGDTRSGAIMGTPSYMPPEQAAGRKFIGPSADIYALGAILYEMLTGRPPFRAESPTETMFQVLTADLLSPRRLQPKLPVDLETICLKCLEKDPARRYRSAQELADDLGHFLAGEPIIARPVSSLGRTVKWVRRQPALAALLAVVVTGIFTVLAVAIAFNIRLQRAHNLSESRRIEAEEQGGKALANLRKAREAVDQMLTRVGYDRLAAVPHLETLRRDLLKDARQFYQELAANASDDRELRREVGLACGRAGAICTMLGENGPAEQNFREAVAVHTKLCESYPDQPQHQQDLAAGLDQLGKFLADLYRFADAEPIQCQAVDQAERLVADFPDTVDYRHTLGVSINHLGYVLQKTDHPTEAGQAYHRSMELLERVVAGAPKVEIYQDDLAETNNNLAVFLALHNQPDEAEKAFRRDMVFWQGRKDRFPDRSGYRVRLARSTYNLGNFFANRGRRADSEPLVRQAVDIWRTVVSDFSKFPAYHLFLGQNLSKLAELVHMRKDYEQACTLCEEAIREQRLGLPTNPGSLSRGWLIATYLQLSEARLAQGRHHQAAAAVDEALRPSPDQKEAFYMAAGILARCVPVAKKNPGLSASQGESQGEIYARQAIDLISKAIEKGFRDHERLRKAPEFESLRSRKDFQQIVLNLEK
jgi:serine/threonine-protein kinase